MGSREALRAMDVRVPSGLATEKPLPSFSQVTANALPSPSVTEVGSPSSYATERRRLPATVPPLTLRPSLSMSTPAPLGSSILLTSPAAS